MDYFYKLITVTKLCYGSDNNKQMTLTVITLSGLHCLLLPSFGFKIVLTSTKKNYFIGNTLMNHVLFITVAVGALPKFDRCWKVDQALLVETCFISDESFNLGKVDEMNIGDAEIVLQQIGLITFKKIIVHS
jgi:hypothetical protein